MATVFLSCGQREGEKLLAHKIQTMIESDLKFERCYNADSVQGFDDVMSITERLAESDYFLFIDFKREGPIPVSVFTHQEFALARAWGIENMLAFIEEGLDPRENGMLAYVLAHPTKFKREELVAMVKRQIKAKGWRDDYSRSLVATKLDAKDDILRYADHTGQSSEKIWQIVIENRRSNRAAVNVVAILDTIERVGCGTRQKSPDRSHLKWVEQYCGYMHTILPQDFGLIDAFAIRVGETGVFLHSQWDFRPRNPIITEPGKYLLTYKIYAEHFPILAASVRLNYAGPIVAVTRTEEPLTTAQLE
ncbi:hypothetical protein KAX17_02655 [Candidatus Bipolaricaulota bacterium]|nr:hypothetical protein [Candidatus Bipolaricaulota bacterium]